MIERSISSFDDSAGLTAAFEFTAGDVTAINPSAAAAMLRDTISFDIWSSLDAKRVEGMIERDYGAPLLQTWRRPASIVVFVRLAPHQSHSQDHVLDGVTVATTVGYAG